MERPSQEDIKKAREAFQKDGIMPVIDIAPKVLESWIRSRNAGVIPERVDKTLISPQELQQRIAVRKNFFDTASSVLAGIYRFTIGSGFMAAIFDEDGYVLSVSGDEEILRIAKANGLAEGCNRDEKNIGTNGIGTALVIGDAIKISGEEHYFPLHYNWTCSGAPVFDLHGHIIGGLCIIGPMPKVHLHTLGMAAAAAKATTQLLLMQNAYDKLNRMQQSNDAMLSAWPSGVMLVDKNLRIISVNRGAALLLGKRIEQLEDHPLREFMPQELFALGDQGCIRDRPITLEIGRKTVRLSLSVEITDAGDYVLFFEKTETLHKRINRIVGSEARFILDDIIGDSAVMVEAIRMAQLAAQNRANVFLKGESGTGKEMFAQAIHNASSRRDGPFVAINCGAIPKSLVESELFGYEGGAFTGAKRDGCPGKFELANGGTIFLDEIGDMPFDVQASLLRVLQSREVSRIGSTRTIKIDVRVISATHQNVEEKILHNEFRNDLYYRLNVFDISIPALRERQEDIIPLAEHFLYKYAGNAGHRIHGFSPDALMALKKYSWPGNVRELENIVERAVYVSPHALIEPQSLSIWSKMQGEDRGAPGPLLIPDDAVLGEPEAKSKAPNPVSYENERKRIENALYSTGFKVKKAAELLGVSRRTMYRRMSSYGISKETYLK
ncbi:MAG: sigma 54-interacting transcriptional regulator [Treponema sp.]|jgi:transcriptional regulator of acetoin/glycerol metabolism|nr:sigma 54-interacting transcriptional regulator [Treponema sp.]